MQDQVKQELIRWEYRFKTTPQFCVIEDGWKLHDVFLKRLDNECFVFVPVFRKRVNQPKD